MFYYNVPQTYTEKKCAKRTMVISERLAQPSVLCEKRALVALRGIVTHIGTTPAPSFCASCHITAGM